MNYQSGLRPARLIRRYKRFLADVETDTGELLTLHCPNTGAMTGCGDPGSRVWYSRSSSKTRKYPCTWELTELADGTLVCINTQLGNRLVAEAFAAGRIDLLKNYGQLTSEVKIVGEKQSRLDFLAMDHRGNLPDCYIEVKNVTLAGQDGLGLFPDTTSVRAQKHLRTLEALAGQGKRALLIFCVCRGDIRTVAPACTIDPVYAQLFASAVGAGVEAIACRVEITREQLMIEGTLPVVMARAAEQPISESSHPPGDI